MNPHARQLRQTMTEADRMMWFALRGRRLNGHKFKRQWSLGPYVVDFCCIERRFVVEVDGGQHNPACDATRTSALNRLGYRVVRYWNNDIRDNLDGVLTDLLAKLDQAPHPNPLPQAGEGA